MRMKPCREPAARRLGTGDLISLSVFLPETPNVFLVWIYSRAWDNKVQHS